MDGPVIGSLIPSSASQPLTRSTPACTASSSSGRAARPWPYGWTSSPGAGCSTSSPARRCSSACSQGLHALPLLLLSPVAGAAADRFDRKLQMLVAPALDGLTHAAVALL